MNILKIANIYSSFQFFFKEKRLWLWVWHNDNMRFETKIILSFVHCSTCWHSLFFKACRLLREYCWEFARTPMYMRAHRCTHFRRRGGDKTMIRIDCCSCSSFVFLASNVLLELHRISVDKVSRSHPTPTESTAKTKRGCWPRSRANHQAMHSVPCCGHCTGKDVALLANCKTCQEIWITGCQTGQLPFVSCNQFTYMFSFTNLQWLRAAGAFLQSRNPLGKVIKKGKKSFACMSIICRKMVKVCWFEILGKFSWVNKDFAETWCCAFLSVSVYDHLEHYFCSGAVVRNHGICI